MPFSRRKIDTDYEQAAKLLADGNYRESIDVLRQIISKSPRHTNAMVSLAVALIEQQDTPEKDSPLTEEALGLLDKAAAQAPRDAVPLFNKGVCLRDLGMLEEALVSFQAALDIEKRLPLAILHMAEINYELGRWEESIELARLALIRDPGLEGSMEWVRDAVSKAAGHSKP
jgi:tetratricopeptide (TPR) repeat protein